MGHSVEVGGRTGRFRSYRPIFLVSGPVDQQDHATQIINQDRRINRVVALAAGHVSTEEMRVHASAITDVRLGRLRAADAAVRRLCHASGFESNVWQFPVILVPVGAAGRPDSVVLRPIHSVDGMTARSVPIRGPARRDVE